MAEKKAHKKLEYVQDMRVKAFDLKAGKYICILNEADAKELGILPLERVEIYSPKTKRRVTCVADITDSMVGVDEIGVFNHAKEKLRVKTLDRVEVKAVPRPKSVAYIKKKLAGKTLSKEEIFAIVHDLGRNTLSEIEAAAFVSAVYVRGYTLDETVYMTQALAEDGLQLRISKKPVVDKHSVGGVNGRATMIIVPILASAGCYVPKTSSRSITSAAGTADAMEVLANVSLTAGQIKRIVEKIGGVIAWGGALELAPVDDKIIKIEHPLALDPQGQIVASVMAKKASVGAKYVVVDIPVGPDVKVNSRETAEEIARVFIEVGKKMGIRVEVVVTDGTEPSGRAFGPALEARYVLEILEGIFYDNLAQKSCELAGVMLELCGKAKEGQGFKKAKEILESGIALKKMKEIIKAQGVKVLRSKNVHLGKYKEQVFAKEGGEIRKINIRECMHITKLAGAPGHKRAGLLLKVEEGQNVKKGDLIFEIYAENERKIKLAKKYAKESAIVEMEKIILQTFG